MKISTKGTRKLIKLFNRERIPVYPKLMALADITFWAENNRTLLTFDELKAETHAEIADLPLDDVVRYVASKNIHNLDKLARSIAKNGVRSPLILSDDGTLLDGNRRFFACQIVRLRSERKRDPLPDVLKGIPVWIIKKKDISEKQKQKILAEYNFVDELKEPWPLDKRANAVGEYYNLCISRQMEPDAAIAEIEDVFDIKRARVLDYLDTLKLTDQFLAPDQKGVLKRRQVLENSFVYFWEFRNKSMKGSSKISDDADKYEKVRKLFFRFMEKGTIFSNIKQVEPFIRASNDTELWEMVVSSKGTDLDLVVSTVEERKAAGRSADKIRLFDSWLKNAAPNDEESYQRLESLVATCNAILSRRKKRVGS